MHIGNILVPTFQVVLRAQNEKIDIAARAQKGKEGKN